MKKPGSKGYWRKETLRLLRRMGLKINNTTNIALAWEILRVQGRSKRESLTKADARRIMRHFVSTGGLVSPAFPVTVSAQKQKPFVQTNAFLQSEEWRAIRYGALKRAKGRCQCCGARGGTEGVILQVDHIKPRSKYPELALDPTNLQVLCKDCNFGKSNIDETDWRDNVVPLVRRA